MKYVSTRGQAPELGFRDVILAGLARDGGLYLPNVWPKFSTQEIGEMAGLSYAQTAKRVLAPFVEGEIEADVFGAMVDEAYGTFNIALQCRLFKLHPIILLPNCSTDQLWHLKMWRCSFWRV